MSFVSCSVMLIPLPFV